MKRRDFAKTLAAAGAALAAARSRAGPSTSNMRSNYSFDKAETPVILEVAISGSTTKKINPAAPETAAELANEVGLGDKLHRNVRRLSQGERQRVALARGLLLEPRVLFCDEPTGNLDSRTGETIMELMFELNRSSSTTLVLVTHDSALADRCDRVLALEAGRLVSDSRAAA